MTASGEAAAPAVPPRDVEAEGLAPRPVKPGSIAELLRFRQLVALLVVRELKVRYKRSVLGMLWTMLNPLLLMVVYTVVFTTIFPAAQENFSVFLLSGLLPWLFFATSLLQGLWSVVANQELIRKVRVPQAVFPLSVVGSNLVNFLFSLVPLFLMMALLRQPFTSALLFLPVAAVILTLFISGVALVFATATVFFRDVRHLTEVLLQMLMYLSPIFYDVGQLGNRDAWWFRLFSIWLRANPISSMIPLLREPVYYGRWPAPATIIAASCWAVFSAVAGYSIFRRLSPKHIHNL